MRTIHKQEHHVGGERVAAMTVRQTLRSLGVKDFMEHTGGWRNRLPASPSAESDAIRLVDRIDMDSALGVQSSNDAAAESAPVTVNGGAEIPPIEHSSAIAYILSCQPDRHLLYVSPQISNLGFAPVDLLDHPDLRLKQVHEEDFGRFDRALRRSCSAAEKFSCHYRLYDNRGNVRWFHDEASVVCDETGAPLFIKGVMLDITEKKRMEAELADHRYYLERNVEQRTRQLAKRIELLESCNTMLCSQLSSARLEIAALKRQLQLAAPETGEDRSFGQDAPDSLRAVAGKES
ncbi:MAG TPA: PAS domain-containing protein [Gallionella sp.]|nr:PAS domain-containing protein [Gallionella sp.]